LNGRVLAWLLLFAVAGGLARPAKAAPVPQGWDYEVRLDENLKQLDVRICFRRFLPRRLVLPKTAALRAFEFPRGLEGEGTLRLAADRQSVVPVGLRPGGCVRYRVDLELLSAGSRRARDVSRVGRDVVAAPGALFLRPALWPRDAQVSVGFEMPAGTRAAVPWPPRSNAQDGKTYRVDPHALQLQGMIALGHFQVDEVQIAGTRLDLAVLDAPHRATRKGIRSWISAAVSAVADLYGRFPTERVLILVQPVPARRPPVIFGSAMRAGGGHVHLLMAAAAADEDLPGEWVAVHEMTHLGMPWTFDGDAWMQEGFVTYYQEVLRARAGFLTEQQAWQNIHEGFGRGRVSGGRRPLSIESREMGRSHNYHRVYWAGAAIALLIDVELRRRSKGVQSLDEVMRLFHSRFGGTSGPHRGSDLLVAVDRLIGQSLCSVVAETCLRSRAFPDVSAVYEVLGLSVVDGRIVLRDEAPLAAVRKAIMRRGGK